MLFTWDILPPYETGMVWCLRLAGQIAQQKQPPSTPEHHWHLRVIYRAGGWTLSIHQPWKRLDFGLSGRHSSHSAGGEICAIVVGQTSAFDWSTHHFWLEKPVFWLRKHVLSNARWICCLLLGQPCIFLVPPNRIRPTSSISSVALNRVQTGYVPNKPKLGWRTHEDRSFCLFWGGFQSRNATARVSIKKCKRSGIFHLPSHLIMFQIPNPIQDHPRLPGSQAPN